MYRNVVQLLIYFYHIKRTSVYVISNFYLNVIFTDTLNSLTCQVVLQYRGRKSYRRKQLVFDIDTHRPDKEKCVILRPKVSLTKYNYLIFTLSVYFATNVSLLLHVLFINFKNIFCFVTSECVSAQVPA